MVQTETECRMALTIGSYSRRHVNLSFRRPKSRDERTETGPMKKTTKATAARNAKQLDMTRGVLLMVGSLSLGLLSACSNVKTEVIASKNEASSSLTRQYVGHAGRNSLWSIERQSENN